MLTLKETRALVKASQQDLADAAGVDLHLVVKAEQGYTKRPAHDLVVKVVRGLRKLGMAGIQADQIAEFYVPDDAAPAEPQAVNQ